ncbi:glutamate receptor 1.2 [Citrus sinensis]|nr:glutamate receptor 1.2 [Citrus sinensis]
MAISKSSSTGDEAIKKLSMLKSLETKVFVVHMSHALASHLFLHGKKLGMMSKGYAWIITSSTMDFLHSMDSSVVESMQGVLGFKRYVPASKELHNFTASEKLKTDRVPDETFYKQIINSRFTSLSGNFQLVDGKLTSSGAFEIVNVIGKTLKRVGFWSPITRISKEMNSLVLFNKMNISSPSPNDDELEAVIWPGGSAAIPEGGGKINKLRIGVPVNGFKELVNAARDPQGTLIVEGICIDVFKSAIDSLTFEVPYEFIPFEDASGRMAGSYNDLIDQKFDVVVGDTTITANRSLYVDFTLPYTEMGIGMIVPIDQSNNIWIFLKPLEPNLWLTTAALFLLTSFVMWIIERPVNDEFQGSRAHQFGMIFWYSFSTLVFSQRSQLGSVVPGALSNLNFKDSRLKKYNSTKEYANALSKESKNGGISAIIDEMPYIKAFLAKYSAHYTLTAPKNTNSTNGFGFVRISTNNIIFN